RGFDWASTPIPVTPAAHYLMGGVATDLDGRTSLAGVFAVGETACTGVHGANRLASNSLLEGAVFAVRAVAALGCPFESRKLPYSKARSSNLRDSNDFPGPNALQQLMWDQVGLLRTHDGL